MAGGQNPFDTFAETTQRPFETLMDARARTREGLERRRELLTGMEIDGDTAVVLHGSWGRHEVTSGSDDDIVILVHSDARDAVHPSMEELSERLAAAGEYAPPGQEATFGEVV